jgi:hypothetical protein
LTYGSRVQKLALFCLKLFWLFKKKADSFQIFSSVGLPALPQARVSIRWVFFKNLFGCGLSALGWYNIYHPKFAMPGWASDNHENNIS